MRIGFLVAAVVVPLLAACESPLETSDRTVLMSADWTPPAGPLAPGTVVAGEPAVVLTDAAGRPRAGVVVRFQPIVPPLVVAASVDTTDADGRAVMPVAWTLGSQEGTQQLIVHVPTGQTNAPVVFSVVVSSTP